MSLFNIVDPRHQDSAGSYTNPTQTLISTCLFLQLCHSSLFISVRHLQPLPWPPGACGLYKGILRPVMGSATLPSPVHCCEANAPFPHLISSKIGCPAKLQLRLKRRYGHDNNALYLQPSPIRKIPLFGASPSYPTWLGDQSKQQLLFVQWPTAFDRHRVYHFA